LISKKQCATTCQEPCAKTYSVLGFLSTFKNAFFLCELKQAEFIKSIFDVSKIDDCQSSLNFEALKGVVCKGTCFRENQGFSGP